MCRSILLKDKDRETGKRKRKFKIRKERSINVCRMLESGERGHFMSSSHFRSPLLSLSVPVVLLYRGICTHFGALKQHNADAAALIIGNLLVCRIDPAVDWPHSVVEKVVIEQPIARTELGLLDK